MERPIQGVIPLHEWETVMSMTKSVLVAVVGSMERLRGVDSNPSELSVQTLEEAIVLEVSLLEDLVSRYQHNQVILRERISSLEVEWDASKASLTELQADYDKLISENEMLLKKIGEWEEALAVAAATKNNNSTITTDTDPMTSLAGRMGVRFESFLARNVTVNQQADRFVLFFDSAFYNQNRDECYGWLGGLLRHAHKKSFSAEFDRSGYLVIVARKNSYRHPGNG